MKYWFQKVLHNQKTAYRTCRREKVVKITTIVLLNQNHLVTSKYQVRNVLKLIFRQLKFRTSSCEQHSVNFFIKFRFNVIISYTDEIYPNYKQSKRQICINVYCIVFSMEKRNNFVKSRQNYTFIYLHLAVSVYFDFFHE